MVWQILEPWWITKRHRQRHVSLFRAVPFDLYRDFFSTGSSLFPFWGITSIKITGLGDQLLLRVLSLLLLASSFCGPNTQACSNKCLNHHWSVPSLSFTRSWWTCDWRSHFNLSSPILLHIYVILLLISLESFDDKLRDGLLSFCVFNSTNGRHKGGTHLHGQESRLCAYLQGNAEGWHRLWMSTWISAYP